MTVYVDELQVWPHAKHRCFMSGSSHLEADTLEELHAFARRLGLKREWFQPRSSPHYDLSPAKHARALSLGARFRSSRESALERLCKRRRPDFAVFEVIDYRGAWKGARWTFEGHAYELIAPPEVARVELLSECFDLISCLDRTNAIG